MTSYIAQVEAEGTTVEFTLEVSSPLRALSRTLDLVDGWVRPDKVEQVGVWHTFVCDDGAVVRARAA